MTYLVGFVFLHFELEDNFAWALTMLKGLLSSQDNMPKVIVTDRDGALMKAVGTVFPKTYTMLCYFHIGKNVRAKYIVRVTLCMYYCHEEQAKIASCLG